MRYLILAGLMFALGVVIDTLQVEPRTYFPVVRLRTGEGFFITVVQAGTRDPRQCSEATDRFVVPIRRLCPTCVVESEDCDSTLHGFEKALADGAAVPLYTVSGGGVRLALVGPPEGTKASCEAIGEQMVVSGAPSASCVFPGVVPASAGPMR